MLRQRPRPRILPPSCVPCPHRQHRCCHKPPRRPACQAAGKPHLLHAERHAHPQRQPIGGGAFHQPRVEAHQRPHAQRSQHHQQPVRQAEAPARLAIERVVQRDGDTTDGAIETVLQQPIAYQPAQGAMLPHSIQHDRRVAVCTEGNITKHLRERQQVQPHDTRDRPPKPTVTSSA